MQLSAVQCVSTYPNLPPPRTASSACSRIFDPEPKTKAPWERMQVPALKKHLAAALKSAEAFLSGVDAQEQQQ